jgi:hypothetical protein
MFKKNAKIRELKCEPLPDGERMICQTLVVTDKGEMFEDKVYANMPKVKVKKTKKGVEIDYGD